MLGIGHSALVVIGTVYECGLLGILSIMMGEVVLPLIPLSGIRVVFGKCASLIIGSMLILPLYPAFLVS